MATELDADDLTRAGDFLHRLGMASKATGVDYLDGFLWLHGDLIGRVGHVNGEYILRSE